MASPAKGGASAGTGAGAGAGGGGEADDSVTQLIAIRMRERILAKEKTAAADEHDEAGVFLTTRTRPTLSRIESAPLYEHS